MNSFRRGPLKLHDCKIHGPDSGAELFLVEGDSASANVAKCCDSQLQAVLPMQGKPLNAIKASTDRVADNPWFKALFDAIGIAKSARTKIPVSDDGLRYQRIVLLFDPDADGIHCGALMLMFFHRFLPSLLEQNRLLMVRPPLFRVTHERLQAPAYASSQAHYEHIVAQLKKNGVTDHQTLRYRGLGSLEETLLREHCIDPTTRKADLMGPCDAQMAIEVFAANTQ